MDSDRAAAHYVSEKGRTTLWIDDQPVEDIVIDLDVPGWRCSRCHCTFMMRGSDIRTAYDLDYVHQAMIASVVEHGSRCAAGLQGDCHERRTS